MIKQLKVLLPTPPLGLAKVKNSIITIKVSYEKDISDLKNNINFFEQSIALINNIKGEE